MKKLRVAVLYGGRSGEHEVSLQSAASVINYLDRDRFEIVPVAIDKQGRWHLNDVSLIQGKKSLPVFEDAPRIVLPPDSAATSALISLGGSGGARAIDVVFLSSMGLFAKTEQSKGYLSWQMFHTLDAESSHPQWRWTKRWQNAWPAMLNFQSCLIYR